MPKNLSKTQSFRVCECILNICVKEVIESRAKKQDANPLADLDNVFVFVFKAFKIYI